MNGLDETIYSTCGDKTIVLLKTNLPQNCAYLKTCIPYRRRDAQLHNCNDNQIKVARMHEDSIVCRVQEFWNCIDELNYICQIHWNFDGHAIEYGLCDQLCIPIIASKLIEVWYKQNLKVMFQEQFWYILHVFFEKYPMWTLLATSELHLVKCFEEINMFLNLRSYQKMKLWFI